MIITKTQLMKIIKESLADLYGGEGPKVEQIKLPVRCLPDSSNSNCHDWAVYEPSPKPWVSFVSAATGGSGKKKAHMTYWIPFDQIPDSYVMPYTGKTPISYIDYKEYDKIVRVSSKVTKRPVYQLRYKIADLYNELGKMGAWFDPSGKGGLASMPMGERGKAAGRRHSGVIGMYPPEWSVTYGHLVKRLETFRKKFADPVHAERFETNGKVDQKKIASFMGFSNVNEFSNAMKHFKFAIS